LIKEKKSKFGAIGDDGNRLKSRQKENLNITCNLTLKSLVSQGEQKSLAFKF
jgi:hypothetical protein